MNRVFLSMKHTKKTSIARYVQIYEIRRERDIQDTKYIYEGKKNMRWSLFLFLRIDETIEKRELPGTRLRKHLLSLYLY